MQKLGPDTYQDIKRHFNDYFVFLDDKLSKIEEDKDPNYDMMIFLFNSMEYLSKLYSPRTGIKVL